MNANQKSAANAHQPPPEAGTNVINFKLRPTPGNVNIYAPQGDTTCMPLPPLDDFDDLPPPPPPPELCMPSPPLPPPTAYDVNGLGTMAVAPSAHTPYTAPTGVAHLASNQTHSSAPATAGVGNSYLLHQQQQGQHLPPPSPPLPPSSSSAAQHQFSKDYQEKQPGLAPAQGEKFLGKEKIIADSLAVMDWIPEDIDLSQCPDLVEITRSTPNWKKEMIEKKNQEKIEEYVKQILKEREQEKKWKNIPVWKRKLLEKKDGEPGAPDVVPASKPHKLPRPVPEEDMRPKGDIVPAALSIDPEELAAMPPWKRELLFKRDKVPVTFSNEFNPDEDEEGEGGENMGES